MSKNLVILVLSAMDLAVVKVACVGLGWDDQFGQLPIAKPDLIV
jgi:hypothetical protein